MKRNATMPSQATPLKESGGDSREWRLSFGIRDRCGCPAGSQACDRHRYTVLRQGIRADDHSAGSAGALRLTTARYYTPAGRSIQAKGIDADIVIEQELPPELQGKNVSTKVKRACAAIFRTRGWRGRWGSSAYVPEDKAKDLQLKAAIDLLHGMKVVTNAKPRKRHPPVPRLVRKLRQTEETGVHSC